MPPQPPPETVEQAYEALKLAFIETLVQNAIDANIAGQVKAGMLMKIPLDFRLVSSRAVAATLPYKQDLIEKGGSMIQGEFKPWLADMIESDRQAVSAIIEQSVREGTPLRDVSKALDQVFTDQEHRSQLVAYQETKRLYNTGTMNRFKEERIQQLEWVHLDPQNNPREDHQALDGKIFNIDDPIWNELEAYNCHCYAIPVISSLEE